MPSSGSSQPSLDLGEKIAKMCVEKHRCRILVADGAGLAQDCPGVRFLLEIYFSTTLSKGESKIRVDPT